MTDYQFTAIAEMFLDIIESSKDLEEAKKRIDKILRNAKKTKASSDE